MRAIPLRCILFVLMLSMNIQLSGQTIVTGTPVPTILSSYAAGFAFDVAASSTVEVVSLDLRLSAAGYPPLPAPRAYEIWTVTDGTTFLGHETRPDFWTKVADFEHSLFGFGPYGWTNMMLPEPVVIPAGGRRGFYVVESSALSIIYGYPAPLGSIQATGPHIKIHAGIRNFYFSQGSAAVPAVQVHYKVHGPFGDDLEALRVVAPQPDELSCQALGTSEQVSVVFRNLGTNTLPAGLTVPVTLQVDGGGVIQETLTLPTLLAPSAEVTYQFTTTVDLSAIGPHLLSFSHGWPQDQFSGNDSHAVSLASGGTLRVTEFPYFEDFESMSKAARYTPPLGWTQETTESAGGFGMFDDWAFVNDQSLTQGIHDRSLGDTGLGTRAIIRDIMVSGSAQDHNPINLRSPCFDFANLNSPRLTFWYRNYSNASMTNTLSLDVYDLQTGAVTLDVGGPWGDSPVASSISSVLGWYRVDVDLSAFAGCVVRLIFRGRNDSLLGTDEQEIDDIAVYDYSPSLGQPEQVGLASFRVGPGHNALNRNFRNVDEGVGGPFLVKLKGDDLLTMEFGGEPNRPFLLLGSVANEGIASYPNVGILDIGVAPNPVSGIPTGILVLADGNLTYGLNPFFVTNAVGDGLFAVQLPNLPPGILGTFQCLMTTSGVNGAFIALSNALQIEIE